MILPDPFAIRLLGPHTAELDRTPRWPDRPHSSSLRAWIVARSRFAEEVLCRAVADFGVTQYLLLGAGLDTFALRNPCPNLHVFEVDHPSTQAWKQQLLAASQLSLDPRHTTFVPVDFESDQLIHALARAGFDPALPTQISWLGVVPYLTFAAFRSTVEFFQTLSQGSGLVLDYIQPRGVLPKIEQREFDSLASRVALSGEPFQLMLSRTEVYDQLGTVSGFEDLGRDDLNALYFQSRTDELQIVRSAARLLSARR